MKETIILIQRIHNILEDRKITFFELVASYPDIVSFVRSLPKAKETINEWRLLTPAEQLIEMENILATLNMRNIEGKKAVQIILNFLIATDAIIDLVKISKK